MVKDNLHNRILQASVIFSNKQRFFFGKESGLEGPTRTEIPIALVEFSLG